MNMTKITNRNFCTHCIDYWREVYDGRETGERKEITRERMCVKQKDLSTINEVRKLFLLFLLLIMVFQRVMGLRNIYGRVEAIEESGWTRVTEFWESVASCGRRFVVVRSQVRVSR